ncbi:hypothetical protein TNCV_1257091 [Trichonephila clavipes]|nr:hypothetical protein TNCV_1257091 [Trichonephila clavipes]
MPEQILPYINGCSRMMNVPTFSPVVKTGTIRVSGTFTHDYNETGKTRPDFKTEPIRSVSSDDLPCHHRE